MATTGFTAAARSLLDDTTTSAMLTTLGVSTFAKTILDDADAATVRTTIGAAAAGSYQTADADLTAIAALTTTAYGRSVLETTDDDDFRETILPTTQLITGSDDTELTAIVDTPWGIDDLGVPYFDAAGPALGEAALMHFDDDGAPYLIPLGV
jgi:hypothetical protein